MLLSHLLPLSSSRGSQAVGDLGTVWYNEGQLPHFRGISWHLGVLEAGFGPSYNLGRARK